MLDIVRSLLGALRATHLRRVLRTYLGYYHRTRCHLALARDALAGRAVQGPEQGKVIAPRRSADSIIATNGGRHDRGWVSGRGRLGAEDLKRCMHDE